MGRTRRADRGQDLQQQAVLPICSSVSVKLVHLEDLKQEYQQPAKVVEASENTKPEAEKKKRRKRKAKNRKKSYAVSIFRVLRQIYQDIKISKRAMEVLDCFMHDIFERIASEAAILTKYSKLKTMTPLHIEGATKLVLNGALTTHAVHCGASAVVKFIKNTYPDS